MSSRSTIIVTAIIATLGLSATGAFARMGGSSGHIGGSVGHMGSFSGHVGSYSGHMGSYSGHMGSYSGHVGDHGDRGRHFHDFHHRHFFIVGGYPYDDDYYDYGYEDCPLVHVRVATRHGPRWRWVPSCEY